jgi:hypothetical protein
LKVSCTLILFHFVCLWPHPSWKLEEPLGSWRVSISSWPGLDSRI